LQGEHQIKEILGVPLDMVMLVVLPRVQVPHIRRLVEAVLVQ
jgi:hypothetical protein